MTATRTHRTTVHAAGIDRIAPISLDDLNDVAALQTRTDRKYVLEPGDLAALVAELPSSVRVLEIDGQRSFGYRSTYFDTPDHVSYLNAARRRRQRWKVRIRSYENADQAMLEVKTKDGRGNSVKTRTPHADPDRHSLDDEARRFIAAAIGDHTSSNRLVPSLTTSYRRTTLVDLDDNTRCTIDHDLACTGWTGRRATIGDRLIVETKSSGSPSAIDRWLWGHGIRPTKVSKYCTGLASLQPELPSNKWHRTLQRHWRVDRAEHK